MDEACRGSQQVSRAHVSDPSPPRRQNHRFLRDKFFCELHFQLPEFGFATLGEELGDGASGTPFDLDIEVYERSAEALGHGPPDGRLSGARESDEHEMTIKLASGDVAHPKRSSSRAR